LNPKIKIIGVQSEALPAMKAALADGAPVRLPPATTIADGIAVRRVGETPFALVREFVDDIVTVSEGEIANAVLLLLEIEKTVAEGAAAVPLAALMNKKIPLAGKNIGLIVSGGNIDMNLIARIIEKGMIQDGRQSRLNVIVTDRPGNLARLTQCIADQGANILQIGQSRGFGRVAIGETEVELVLETTGADHIQRLRDGLNRDGFRLQPEE
jgi:threonine dehydratase